MEARDTEMRDTEMRDTEMRDTIGDTGWDGLVSVVGNSSDSDVRHEKKILYVTDV
jgi:hypothetical protein